jgi:hypothetical protein
MLHYMQALHISSSLSCHSSSTSRHCSTTIAGDYLSDYTVCSSVYIIVCALMFALLLHYVKVTIFVDRGMSHEDATDVINKVKYLHTLQTLKCYCILQ